MPNREAKFLESFDTYVYKCNASIDYALNYALIVLWRYLTVYDEVMHFESCLIWVLLEKY